MTGLALLAVHQRIGKAADMAGSDPDLRIHQDSAVETDIVLAFLNETLPPKLFNIIFKLNAERTVIPRV